MAVEIKLASSDERDQLRPTRRYSTFLFLISMAMGIPLLLSGIGHLANMHLFLDSVYRYQVLPNAFVPFAASFLPAASTVTGTALVLGQLQRASLCFAAGLYGCFACAQLIQLVSDGSPVDCGCFVWLAHETSFTNVIILLLTSAVGLTTAIAIVPKK